MAPAVHLALALFFLPTLILSEPLHISLTHRRQTKSIRDWADEANYERDMAIQLQLLGVVVQTDETLLQTSPYYLTRLTFLLFLFYINSLQQ